MMMTMQRGQLDYKSAYGVLRKYWDPRIGDNVRNMKSLRDGSGVVFDIKSDHFEVFMENFERLKETERNCDFDVSKCTELPDLEEETGFGGGGNWRQ